MTTCPNCQHTFEVETPVSVVKDIGIEFNTFLGLADAVLAHVKATGAKVLSSDDPMRRLVGFETNDRSRRWTIPLTRIMRGFGMDNPNDPQMGRYDLYRSYVSAAAGRTTLAALWSEGREPTEKFKGS